MSLVLAKRFKKRPGYQLPSSLLQKHAEKKAVEVDEDNDSQLVRRWDEMDHEILINIMTRLNWTLLQCSVCIVCKSWLNALLDMLFPPGDVLDLRFFLATRNYSARKNARYGRYCHFIDLNFRRSRVIPYTKVVLPDFAFSGSMYSRLSYWLPSLKSIVFPMSSSVLYYFRRLAPCWNELEEVHCRGSFVGAVARYWNNIRRLGLKDVVKVDDAFVIARNFPRLTHLYLKRCCLLDNALTIILEGQKNLICLDTRHAFIRDEKDYDALGKTHVWGANEWNDEVLSKATGVKQLLKCERRNCPICFRKYM